MSETTKQSGANAAELDRELVLEVHGVSKRYPGVLALNDVSMTVLGGEVHAVLGENGAGKSTLMGVASGEVAPDSGTVQLGGETIERQNTVQARRRGLAIVHQHPAVLPDLTILENFRLGMGGSEFEKKARSADWVKERLEDVDLDLDLALRVEDTTVAERTLIELAKAVALQPRVLILDEPTAALGADRVKTVFEHAKRAAARGAGVIYITHRLAEVRAIADRVTVMRDGAVRAVSTLDDLTDDAILSLIVGRPVTSTFPEKAVDVSLTEQPAFKVHNYSGVDFSDIDVSVRPKEILGIAGVAGNGQNSFLRSLAGLERASGEVLLHNRPLRLSTPAAARAAGIAYLPADRHREGLFMGLSVRENAALSALPRFASRGIINQRVERTEIVNKRDELQIKTPSIDNVVSSLSGGNQQKVVLARALLEEPNLILAEEPTQGVDAGAHIEIYKILRKTADDGVPVIVLSTDGRELAGLCDRVVVFSRGHLAADLSGDSVTEAQISSAIVTASSGRNAGESESHGARRQSRLGRFARGDYAPAAVLGLLIALLAIYTTSHNLRFMSTFNLISVMTLGAALAFIALGQLIVIMTAGIDISVGPLAGALVVIASFFMSEDASSTQVILGIGLIMLVALGLGALNGVLIRYGRFTPVAATLTTYMALGGLSLLLRPFPDGYISTAVSDAIGWRVGPVPVAAIIAVALTIVLEFALRSSRWGLVTRAVGSDEVIAHRLGVSVNRTVVLAYMACSGLTALGAVMLIAQIGVGDPSQGVAYSLTSITAVVLGGASLFGGRGSFVGALLGALLIAEINSATTFLQLTAHWQKYLIGGLTLIAAALYTQARRARRA